LVAGDKARAQEIANLLADFDAGDKERAQEITNLLADFNARDQERANEVIDLRAEVPPLLNNFKKEREEAAAAWKDLLATMSSTRGGIASEKVAAPQKEVVIAEKPKLKKWPPKIEEVKPEEAKAVIEEAKAVIEETKKEEVPGLSDKEKKILSIINDNPKGITLREIADIMGVAFVTITRDIKKLLAEDLTKKKENRYLPV